MANVKIYKKKVSTYIFMLVLTITEIDVLYFDLQKVGQGHEVKFLQFEGKYKNLQKSPRAFYATSNHFRDSDVSHLLPSEVDQSQ